MNTASITSAESFQARLLRSEVRRSFIMASLWFVMLAGVLWRRWRGDAVMTTNPIFFSAVGTFTVAICFQAWVYLDSLRCCRRGCRRFRGSWVIGVVVDVSVPIAYLIFAHLYSPRAVEATLSGPVLLCLPLLLCAVAVAGCGCRAGASSPLPFRWCFPFLVNMCVCVCLCTRVAKNTTPNLQRTFTPPGVAD
jgi:hypothetical protein